MTLWLSQDPRQDTLHEPLSCSQAMVAELGILVHGGRASPCCSPQSRLGATPKPHLGGRGEGSSQRVLTNKPGDSSRDNGKRKHWLPHHNCSPSPCVVMETLEKRRQELPV